VNALKSLKATLLTVLLLLWSAASVSSQTPDLRPVILAFGDSMTAGYGVPDDMSYPARLQQTLDERGYKYRVVNMGVTGDTTRGGLVRMSRALGTNPVMVILELGSNDRANGIPPQQTQDNLDQMIARFQRTHIEVVLAGRSLSGGEDVYGSLASKYHLTLISAFLAGVSGNPALTIADGTHPNAEGYAIVVNTIMKSIEPLLKK
jgi:acyl-CoA thioesterase-1